MTAAFEKAIGTFADDAVAYHAQKSPKRVLLRCGGRSYTAATLNDRVDAVARYLQESGLKPGQHVATFLDNSAELLCIALAAFRSGIVLVPVSTKYHPRTADYIFENADVSLAIVNQPGMRRIGFDRKTTLTLAELPDADTVPAAVRAPQDLALIFYTSGSVGRPKGVMISHANVMHGIDSVCRYLPLGMEDRLGAVLPMSFDAGLNFVLSGLNAAGETALLPFVFPQSLVDTMIKLETTIVLAVPSVFHAIAECGGVALPKMRTMASTGGHMDPDLIDRLTHFMPNMEFTVMYGLTEAFRSTFLPPSERAKRRHSIGRPIPHADVHIMLDDDTEAPAGTVGEIVHSGPLVGLGYWKNPEQTAERYRSCPDHSPYSGPGARAVYSGDLGWCDADGYFYFVGRKDRMIKSGGFRISPEEVEEAITAHTPVRQAYAVGVPDAAKGHAVLAFIETCGVEVPDDDALRQALRPHISGFMLPDHFRRIETFPLNSNGKINGQKLMELM